METEFSQRHPWVSQASCRGLAHEEGSFDTFFRDDLQGIANAKRICSTCPVRSECLQYADTQDLFWGVWGGLTYDERTRRRRLRK